MNFLRVSSGQVDLMDAKEVLVFDPESRSATIVLESLQSLPDQNIAFDVKVTHPDFLQAQPRDGVIVGGGGKTNVVLQLLNLKGLDAATLATTPMRVMVCASTSYPLGSQKVKLLCSPESISACIGRRKGLGGGGSNPGSRSSTPPPVLARKVSGTAIKASPPPQPAVDERHHIDPVASGSSQGVTLPSNGPSGVAVPTAADTARPTVANSGSSTGPGGGAMGICKPKEPTFTITMVLGQLRLPPSMSDVLPPGAMCCLQWKRGTATGTTQWYGVQQTAASASTVGSSAAEDPAGVTVCAFGGEQITVPLCEPSTEKRVLFAIGIVTVDPMRPHASSLRGTLKLDASRPTDLGPEETVFPVTLDGRQGAVLKASLSMLSDGDGHTAPSSVTVGALTQRQGTEAAAPAPSTPPPVPRYNTSNPLSPRNRADEAGGSTNSARKLLEPTSLSALRSQLGSLDSTLRATLQPLSPSGGATASPVVPGGAEGSNASSTTKQGTTPLIAATPRSAGAVSTNPLRTFERQMPKSSNVLVAVRIRPRLAFEQPASAATEGDGVGEAWSHDKTTIRATSNDRQYQFDVVFPPQTTTLHVFETLCPPFIENALLGINGTIFMYGQTASGKTHTMFGSEQEAGITPQVIGALFREIEARKREFEDLEVHVVASYFEIYNEELNDLLDLGKKNLQVRSGGSSEGGFTVDVSSVPVRTKDEAMQVLVHGSYNKKIGQSHLNDRSSRSHSIFKLGIEVIGAMVAAGGSDAEGGGGSEANDFAPRRKSNATGGTKPQRTLAELCLVDLAGSETLQEKSGTSQRKETTNINLSLTYLKKVIWELAHKEKHVSYRNSTLTKVLKQAVGGNSRTCVVCCITPAPEHFRDSRNTLVFGTTAKSVVTTTRVNASGGPTNDSVELAKLRAELVRMRGVLEAYDATVQAYGNMEDDFRRVLEENAKLEEQVEVLETENSALRDRQAAAVSPSGGTPSHQGEAAQGAKGSDGDVPPPRFSLPAARNSALLRADAEQHAALLEEAITRLNQVSVPEEDSEGDGAPSHPRRSPQSSGLEEQALDDDDPFDEVDDDATSTRRPAAPKSRPPPTKKPIRKGPVAAPRSIESLQLQLIQQTIDHRVAMQKKDEELERIQEQQVRPTDEIPEIMKKEEKVCLLLDQLHNFLHHGTPMRLVYTGESPISSTIELAWVGSNLPRHAPRIGKVFMYLYTHHQKETYLCFCLVDAEDNKLPKRSSCFEKIPIKDIKRVELGQYSEPFEKLRQWSAALTPSSSDDEHSELCKNLLDRQRMSFTVVAKKGKQYECVCEDEADFEAWVIELNRLLGTSAEWKQPLSIAHMQFYDVLDEAEKTFCSSMHIHPDEYVRAKNKMLKRKEKFVTLFDVRSLAQFDLYHSQRFFYFLRCQGWVSQAALFYLTEKFVASAQPDLDEL